MRRRFVLCLLAACGDTAREPLRDAATPPADAGTAVDAATLVRDAGAAADADEPLDAAGAHADGSTPAPTVVSVLEDVTLDGGVRYQLLKLEQAPHAPTYAQWYPPPGPGAHPVVVMTKPYEGIAWTGEPVDARWAALGTGAHPDGDAPGAGADAGAIMYTLSDPRALDDYSLWRLNGMGTLLLYGRYYAGGDVQNDIDDMTIGLSYLALDAQADATRIGIWGGSWGGFEALYGAAYAAEGVKPRVGAALSPLSDFAREVDFVTRELPSLYALGTSRDASAAFFAPYLRRIGATVGRNSGYAGLRAADLAARIRVPFLLVHDDWDTLVSYDQSTKLVELAPEHFTPLWLRHPAAPLLWDQALNDHGPLMKEYAGAVISFLAAFMLTHLAGDGEAITSYWDAANVRALSNDMLARQRAGADVGFYAARLRELSDPRVTLLSTAGGPPLSGAEAAAGELNAVWRTQLGAADVRGALGAGMPPAP